MLIVKIGGGAAINLQGVATDLGRLEEPALVVLGANAVRDELARRLGVEKRVLTSVSGYDSVYSDADAIDLIMMSYAGLRCRRFVELCQREGVNAVGLAGIDGRVVQGRRNRGIRVREGGKTLIKRDFSGKPRAANVELLRLLLDRAYLPVISIPIADEQGAAINSENDDIVNVLQQGLHARAIVQLIEAPGLLDDPDDPGSLVRTLERSELERREQQVQGRIKRKLLALRRLLDAGAAQIVIGDGRVAEPVRAALAGHGTTVR